MLKRATSLALITVLMLLAAMPAAASGETFTFELSADKTSLDVGEQLTVTLTVTNNAGDEYGLLAMQNEIFFDNTVFEVVSGSVNTHGISGATTGIRSEENESKFIFAVVDMSLSNDGIRMDPGTTVLTLNFRALSATNTAQLRNENSKILLADDRTEREITDGGGGVITLPITDPTTPTTPTTPGDAGGTGDTPGYSFQTGPRGEIIIDLPDSPLADLPDIHKCYAFTDIDGHWGRAAICFVIERDIFRGVSDTIFDPDGTMTRAMLVTVLHRLENTPAPREAYGFEDLTAGSWYEAAVNWAAQNGIVEGHSETVFAPYDNLTREQMVTILFRYQRFKGQNTSASGDLSGFADSGDISGWAIEGVRYGVGSGLIRGFEDDTVRPQGSATRAQVATIISRMMGLDV